jgi:Protein of unknown function (DUF4239)
VSAVAIGMIVFALVFSSALLAMLVRKALPEHHLSAESKDTVKLGIALIATMSALVLSLLVASAKSAFDTRSNQVVQAAADIILLDRALARYGPETKEARGSLRSSVTAVVERFWSADGARPIAIDSKTSPVEGLYDQIEKLSPQNETQRLLRGEALTMTESVERTRALLFENLGTSIPVPFLVVLVFWLCVIFASFGLFAPPNGTVIVVLCVCALSVAGAIFLILELDRSFEGLLQVSGAPLRTALAQLGR